MSSGDGSAFGGLFAEFAEGTDGSPPEPNPAENPAAESSAERGACERDGRPRKLESDPGPDDGAAPSALVVPSRAGTFTESGALPAGSEIDRDRPEIVGGFGGADVSGLGGAGAATALGAALDAASVGTAHFPPRPLGDGSRPERRRCADGSSAGGAGRLPADFAETSGEGDARRASICWEVEACVSPRASKYVGM